MEKLYVWVFDANNDRRIEVIANQYSTALVAAAEKASRMAPTVVKLELSHKVEVKITLA